jgi:hypothetical protein
MYKKLEKQIKIKISKKYAKMLEIHKDIGG